MKIDRKSHPVARDVRKKGQQKKVHYSSAGRAHLMQMESRLETSGAIAMGLDPRVLSIRSQPMTFDLLTGRAYPSVAALQDAQKLYGFRCIKYTPDFEADLGGSKVLVEVKHRALINRTPKVLEYPNILARYGYRLILLDDHILEDTYVRNLRLLNNARSVRPFPRTAIADTVAACGNAASYGDLLSAGVAEGDLLTALALGHLTFDIRYARLNFDTVISADGDTAAHLKELPLVSIRH
jgi:hypothetical protein